MPIGVSRRDIAYGKLHRMREMLKTRILAFNAQYQRGDGYTRAEEIDNIGNVAALVTIEDVIMYYDRIYDKERKSWL